MPSTPRPSNTAFSGITLSLPVTIYEFAAFLPAGSSLASMLPLEWGSEIEVFCKVLVIELVHANPVAEGKATTADIEDETNWAADV